MNNNNSQRGQGMVEYIILIAVIAVAGLTVWKAFGTGIGAKIAEFTQIILGL